MDAGHSAQIDQGFGIDGFVQADAGNRERGTDRRVGMRNATHSRVFQINAKMHFDLRGRAQLALMDDAAIQIHLDQ
ncbi:hypothetical protein SDC9_207974 [bioreactor metagenome]|uniref:Uncharacterized protein n=1 Tax=bioreactor metagenome TaxID=1076179 RepID=A0A645J9A9_9ZZZZ